MSSSGFNATGPDLFNYMNGITAAQQTQYNAPIVRADSSEANNTLSFQDMLLLMVTQLQNQTIDNTADTNDMMNQIIQMTVMQAITEMSTQVADLTEANILSYSASLVGQTVTVPIYDSKGNIVDERVGTVTGTGIYNGQRVIFIGDDCYLLSQIMAVGTLPKDKTEAPDEDPDVDVDGPDLTNPDDVDPDMGVDDPDESAQENAGAALG